MPQKGETPRFPQGFRWWAQLGLNQRPLRCQEFARSGNPRKTAILCALWCGKGGGFEEIRPE